MLFRKIDNKLNIMFKKRGKVFFFLISLSFSLIFLKLIFYQVIDHSTYKKLADNNRIRSVTVKAERGFILDRNNNILVKNKASYNIYLVREDIEDIDRLLSNIQKKVDIDIDLIKKRLKNAYFYQPILAYRGLTFGELSFFLENIEDFSGMKIELEPVRDYLDPLSMSHLIGYLGEVTERDLKNNKDYQGGDLIGKTGVEYFYENILRGKDGKKYVEVDSLGQTLNVINYQKPTPGKTIKLTIDYKLQEFARKVFGDKKGSIIVEDIYTGEILLLYSSPVYDLNYFIPFITSKNWKKLTSDKNKPLINRAIENFYPPGSIFKILMAFIGLSENIINNDTTFNCSGSYAYGNFKYNCWKKTGHGKVDLKKAISESCDVYFYNLGMILGIDKISQYAKKVRLGGYTEIDLPNEKRGVFPNREWKKNAFNQVWFPGETVIASIGQGYIVTTPIQMVNMYASLFNGGGVLKPRVLKSVISSNTEDYINTETFEKIDFPDWVRRSVMEGMKEAVYGLHGTSYRAKVSSITIAGKTGTAQVVSLKRTEQYEDENKIPEKYRDHSWFASIFPANNPKYALIAFVEHGGSGSQSAAALAGAIINKMVDLNYASD
jgi:penicillin-binding protein 2